MKRTERQELENETNRTAGTKCEFKCKRKNNELPPD